MITNSIEEKIDYLINKIEGLNPEYMTIEEASEYAKLSTQTVHNYKDQIGYFKKDRRIIFKRTDIDQFIKTNTIKRV
jgi:low affinity Fe/Cu permease